VDIPVPKELGNKLQVPIRGVGAASYANLIYLYVGQLGNRLYFVRA
jgi:hypothetical protein